MSETEDLLSEIESLAGRVQDHEQGMRKSLAALGARLAAICKNAGITYGGQNFNMDMPGPETMVYGYLYCSEDGLFICTRTTQDDIDDHLGHNEYPGGFKLTAVQECPRQWLDEAVSGGRLRSFLTGFSARLQKEAEDIAGRTKIVDQLTNAPASAIALPLESVAERLGYGRVVDDWRAAQEEVQANPDGAITAACTLVETVCKHILGDMKETLPADQSIHHLYKAVTKKLNLDPADQAEAEMRKLCGGLATATQNIGAVRTKMGDAHGKAAHFVEPVTSLARLAANSAGILATFLMEQWLIQKEDQSAKQSSVS